MNRNDLNRLFTEQVSALLAQGFQINLDTMSGTQGELARIDLCKGEEVVRVLLHREPDYDDSYDGYMVITVARNTNRLWHRWNDIIWNNDLETLSEIKLARISDNYFVTPEEGKAARDRRYAHWKAKHNNPPRRVLLGDAFKSPALRWLKKQPRMKSCRLDEIESVTRVNCESWGRVKPDLYGYEIKARGKTFMLKPPKRDC